MRYRGYLGEVTVAGDLLLLTTHAHGPQRQWQLALSDIGQVRLSMPEGELPGSLQVLPLAPATGEYTVPEGDEYTVQFEAGDADTFTALAAWLEEIVQLNLSDVDVPAEDVGGAADEGGEEEDDGTLVFWGVSDLPAGPEPTAQAPAYAMRLLVAGSITAVLLVAVVVLTWPGGGKKAASHSTAQPTRSSTSAPATPSDGFSITPPDLVAVPAPHQVPPPRWSESDVQPARQAARRRQARRAGHAVRAALRIRHRHRRRPGTMPARTGHAPRRQAGLALAVARHHPQRLTSPG
jgi:hypothetical protein